MDITEYNKENYYSFSDEGDGYGYAYGPWAEAGLKKSDVSEIIHEYSDSPEGWGSEDVMIVFTTPDGRFGFFEAWCDTTGWDCRAGASDVVYAETLEELIPNLTAEARRIFGYEPTPDCGV